MKFISIFLLLSSYLISFETEIVSVFGNSGKIRHILPKGSTGIVIKKIDENFEAIVSYCEVTSKNGKVQFSKFKTLIQDSLPYGNWTPQVGDKVIFENNYKRASILAKNFDDYNTIRRSFKREWVHPDIFTATLNSIGHTSPLLEDFQYLCKEHSIGLIYIGFKESVKVVDCLSMKEIEEKKIILSVGKSIQKPFYSRIKKIEANWFGEGVEEIRNFESYYKGILER